MRRLLGYMRPYRGRIAISLAFLLAQSALQVLGPLLTRTAVDRYIAPDPGQLPGFLARFLPADASSGLRASDCCTWRCWPAASSVSSCRRT